MKFLKKLARSLFGSSRSSKPKTSVAKKKKTAVKKTRRPVKHAKKKPAKKSAPKKKASKIRAEKSARSVRPPSKQPRLVKAALAALPVAEVTHYFPHVSAAVLKIKTGMIRIGDTLHFKGHTTDFSQKVASMQIDHQPVPVARKGDDFGVEVKSRVRAGDMVFKK